MSQDYTATIKIPPVDPATLGTGPAFTFRGHYGDLQWEKYRPNFVSAASMVAAGTVVHPLHTIKVAFQVGNRNEIARGRIPYVYNLYKHYGFLHLYRGYQAAFYSYLFQGPIRSQLRNADGTRAPTPLSFSDSIRSTSAAILGATCLTAPFDLLTTRMQSDPLLPPQFQRKYRSPFQGGSDIIRNEGLLALFRGNMYNLTRISLYSLSLMFAYPYFQNLIHPDYSDKVYTRVVLFSSLSIVTSLAVHPLDTIKTMLQCSLLKQPSFRTVIVPHIQKHGLISLYKGCITASLALTAFPMLSYTVVDILAKSKILQ